MGTVLGFRRVKTFGEEHKFRADFATVRVFSDELRRLCVVYWLNGPRLVTHTSADRTDHLLSYGFL